MLVILDPQVTPVGVFPLNESSFRVLWPDVGLEGNETYGWSEAAFRGGHRAQAAAGGRIGCRKERPVRGSPPNSECRRRRCTTGAAPTAAWTRTPPRNSRSCESRTPPQAPAGEAELARMSCARWPRESSEPSAKRRAVDMLTTTLSMSERFACKAVGLARSTYRRLPQAQTPADPDAEMRAGCAATSPNTRAMGSDMRGRRAVRRTP